MGLCKFFQQGNCRYGHNCRFEHIYGSKYSYRAPQLQTSKSDQETFSSNASSGKGLNNAASSLFRSAVQNIPTYHNTSNHTFIQNQPARPSVFDRLGPQQGNVFGNQNNEAKSIFAQANESVFGRTQPASNVFQTQNQTSAKSLFAQATQSLFGQHQSSADTNKPLSAPCNTTGNVFQISNRTQSNVFGVSNNVLEQNYNDDDIYSKMEELSKSDIEAFESADFKLGFIPELPPPRILCV